MKRIFCLIGKSGVGKSTVLHELLKIDNKQIPLTPLAYYTTRPPRAGEENGVDYCFISREEMIVKKMEENIFYEEYETENGLYSYLFVDPFKSGMEADFTITITSQNACNKLVQYYGSDFVIPIKIEAKENIRLQRAIQRESLQDSPNLMETFRRLESDCDADEFHLLANSYSFANDDLKCCTQAIYDYIKCFVMEGTK